MSDLLERKVGIVSCSGEELPEGTVARLAALKVLNELRPRETVTICLPLFLAGGAADRAFARLHPTITVDGCDLRCAARATEQHSNKPAASLVVNDLVFQAGLPKPGGRRCLDAAGRQAVAMTAERMASLVDAVVGKAAGAVPAGASDTREPDNEHREATCSCGSGVPVTRLELGGHSVEVVALPLIFRQFRENGRGQDDESKRELFETVKIYNSVPTEIEADYREAVLRAYAAFLQEENPT